MLVPYQVDVPMSRVPIANWVLAPRGMKRTCSKFLAIRKSNVESRDGGSLSTMKTTSALIETAGCQSHSHTLRVSTPTQKWLGRQLKK